MDVEGSDSSSNSKSMNTVKIVWTMKDGKRWWPGFVVDPSKCNDDEVVEQFNEESKASKTQLYLIELFGSPEEATFAIAPEQHTEPYRAVNKADDAIKQTILSKASTQQQDELKKAIELANKFVQQTSSATSTSASGHASRSKQQQQQQQQSNEQSNNFRIKIDKKILKQKKPEQQPQQKKKQAKGKSKEKEVSDNDSNDNGTNEDDSQGNESENDNAAEATKSKGSTKDKKTKSDEYDSDLEHTNNVVDIPECLKAVTNIGIKNRAGLVYVPPKTAKLYQTLVDNIKSNFNKLSESVMTADDAAEVQALKRELQQIRRRRNMSKKTNATNTTNNILNQNGTAAMQSNPATLLFGTQAIADSTTDQSGGNASGDNDENGNKSATANEESGNDDNNNKMKIESEPISYPPMTDIPSEINTYMSGESLLIFWDMITLFSNELNLPRIAFDRFLMCLKNETDESELVISDILVGVMSVLLIEHDAKDLGVKGANFNEIASTAKKLLSTTKKSAHWNFPKVQTSESTAYSNAVIIAPQNVNSDRESFISIELAQGKLRRLLTHFTYNDLIRVYVLRSLHSPQLASGLTKSSFKNKKYHPMTAKSNEMLEQAVKELSNISFLELTMDKKIIIIQRLCTDFKKTMWMRSVTRSRIFDYEKRQRTSKAKSQELRLKIQMCGKLIGDDEENKEGKNAAAANAASSEATDSAASGAKDAKKKPVKGKGKEESKQKSANGDGEDWDDRDTNISPEPTEATSSTSGAGAGSKQKKKITPTAVTKTEEELILSTINDIDGSKLMSFQDLENYMKNVTGFKKIRKEAYTNLRKACIRVDIRMIGEDIDKARINKMENTSSKSLQWRSRAMYYAFIAEQTMAEKYEADYDVITTQHNLDYLVRSIRLGEDREGRAYWHFPGDQGTLYVRLKKETNENDDGNDNDDSLLKSWTSIKGIDNIRDLIKFLDESNKKETLLKAELISLFEHLNRPNLSYAFKGKIHLMHRLRSEGWGFAGSDYLGKKVNHYIEGKGILDGAILACRAKSNGQGSDDDNTDESKKIKEWKVVYEDGTESDCDMNAIEKILMMSSSPTKGYDITVQDASQGWTQHNAAPTLQPLLKNMKSNGINIDSIVGHSAIVKKRDDRNNGINGMIVAVNPSKNRYRLILGKEIVEVDEDECFDAVKYFLESFKYPSKYNIRSSDVGIEGFRHTLRRLIQSHMKDIFNTESEAIEQKIKESKTIYDLGEVVLMIEKKQFENQVDIRQKPPTSVLATATPIIIATEQSGDTQEVIPSASDAEAKKRANANESNDPRKKKKQKAGGNDDAYFPSLQAKKNSAVSSPIASSPTPPPQQQASTSSKTNQKKGNATTAKANEAPTAMSSNDVDMSMGDGSNNESDIMKKGSEVYLNSYVDDYPQLEPLSLWPNQEARNVWIDAVKQARTLSSLGMLTLCLVDQSIAISTCIKPTKLDLL